jgi:hypothetical protein
LALYAEKESIELENKIKHSYDYVIVIPVCNESLFCLENIFTHINENVLIIVVVNSPIGNAVWQSENTLFINNLLDKSIRRTKVSSDCQLLKFKTLNDVMLVDKNQSGQQLHSDQGVGKARKIGCDIALKLYTKGSIKYPWIYSTDADVILPQNYFSQSIKNNNSFSAVVLDFEHITDDAELNQLQFLYDFKLRYYQAGISFAGLDYNYIPLGSTLIVQMECYAQVRGFPLRNAGEDFYLLNKLSKIKPIQYLVDGVIVKIKSRLSDRVPFGTGPALIQIKELTSSEHYKYYHPECFVNLKKWIRFLQSRWTENGLKLEKPSDKILLELYSYLNCESVFKRVTSQMTSQLRWQQFIHQWFDAFKGLKTVHFFDKKYDRLNYLELLKTGSFDKVLNSKFREFIKQNDNNKNK